MSDLKGPLRGLRTVVLVAANVEWRAVRGLLPRAEVHPSPFGEWLVTNLAAGGGSEPVLFFHTGWGKIAAAAGTQYVIDRWAPRLLVNLGTCGGFAGAVERGTIILAERTIVYDIVEQMGEQAESTAHYTTNLDLAWLGDDLPQEVRRTLLVSADRDLAPEELARLSADFGAVAGDWESGAIAFVAARNSTRCLILRGVSDLVGSEGGEAYDDPRIFGRAAVEIMERLIGGLGSWIARFLDSDRT